MILYTKVIRGLNRVCQLQRNIFYSDTKRGVCFSLSKKLPELNAVTSALYVPGETATTIDGFLSPYLDFSKLFENLSDLEFNITQRGLDINVKHIMRQWTEWKELECHRLQLEEEREVIAKKMNSLKKDPASNEKQRELKQCGKKLREQLKDLTVQIWKVEMVVITILQLPNSLHHTTGFSNKQIFSLFKAPSFTYQPKDHVQIGERMGELEFCNNSPSAYYLKNGLALLELACSDYFLSRFKALGYQQQSNPDIVKAIVVEGCGAHYVARHKLNKIADQEADLERNSLHLIGGGSLAAFSAYFSKQIIEKSEYLPHRLVTVGRNYVPTSSAFLGLLGCRQSTVVDAFVVHEYNPVQEMEILDEILLSLIQSYIELQVHFKVIQYCGRHLESYESAAVGVQMFSPNTKEYHEVARISVCGDYISKRLWTLCKSSNKSASFLSMIHIRGCHVARFLGLLMENQQKENGTYDIPNCLQSIISMY
ncbi:serine--tRNA synthetase-like protein Slimp isoform X1 [Procambarus clarkii]|uniref:serine--tRNA synthetase-like protein Slimp isoform X1 n=1 Tax=Procambarus clarkii TaxID=6728 RepID=UPI001E678901|nr:serine--tRNA synthetase-like protein Slimp [Procambarus clarkii]